MKSNEQRIKEFLVKHGIITVPFLKCKLKVTTEEAKRLMDKFYPKPQESTLEYDQKV